MSFELHITCSKDIDKLNIDFSDGSSAITAISESKQGIPDPSGLDTLDTPKDPVDILDLDQDFSTSDNIVQKPNVDIPERNVSVANELQNLDI